MLPNKGRRDLADDQRLRPDLARRRVRGQAITPSQFPALNYCAAHRMLHFAGCFSNAVVVDISPDPGHSDPMYVVSANKLPSARHQGTWRASRRSEARAAASQAPG